MSSSRRAQPETRLEVDLMILDYLLYMGTRSLLQEQVIKREEGQDENLSQYPLQMVNCEFILKMISVEKLIQI